MGDRSKPMKLPYDWGIGQIHSPSIFIIFQVPFWLGTRVLTHNQLPSGNLLHSYWKWQFIVDFPIKNGGFFHSYVKLPEGTRCRLDEKISEPSQRQDVADPAQELAGWVIPFIKIGVTRPGKRLQKTTENHHAINGKTHYFNGHFFNSYVTNYQRVCYWASPSDADHVYFST